MFLCLVLVAFAVATPLAVLIERWDPALSDSNAVTDELAQNLRVDKMMEHLNVCMHVCGLYVCACVSLSLGGIGWVCSPWTQFCHFVSKCVDKMAQKVLICVSGFYSGGACYR